MHPATLTALLMTSCMLTVESLAAAPLPRRATALRAGCLLVRETEQLPPLLRGPVTASRWLARGGNGGGAGGAGGGGGQGDGSGAGAGQGGADLGGHGPGTGLQDGSGPLGPIQDGPQDGEGPRDGSHQPAQS